jgi:hypothetical protein
MTAIRTTSIRTIRRGCASSAGSSACPTALYFPFELEESLTAYRDCRKSKRCSYSALQFEFDLEDNLIQLHDELTSGTYRPGRSICFVVEHPKPREVWAASFRDRIVHHLLCNRIAERFQKGFIADSCACIPGRGTLYAARRLESKIRSITQNWSRPAYYLKCDLSNFFVSIDKRVLFQQLAAKIPEPEWFWLMSVILLHDPRNNFEVCSSASKFALVPLHKQLTQQPSYKGLPIGNLSSQFFANVYLNALDQFIKHQIGARYYIRYVDDFILLHESAQWLNDARARIEVFLEDRLHAYLNPRKTVLQPIDRGVDFVGAVIKPWCRITRRRTVSHALQQIAIKDHADLRDTANSYFGLLRQASHSHVDRARLANAALRRGRAVNADLTKIYARGGK